MPHVINHPRRLMTALTLVLLPAGALAAMVATDQSEGGLRCEIRATPEAGMVTLEALAHTDKHISGNYTFHVESAGGAGGSNIDQSGAFDATPGRTATLGSVSLRSKAGAYDATLDITAGDNTIRCARRIGDAN
ncbi:curli-like amyloid fiber formation chaperone CsgH (plasmid) [Rhizobium sp. CB3090]|uniref:curli-like amyloid fiber formation chaperone CsgH n=1 Tax=Rhizobium sp. CB3090 TaxID=3039156 RepID=UPI0024B1B79C|nr:curli-like amyloid fiber formation chaperone CsgH [Rhizobium sp. CB3090]WFU11963.1 curli-like amyloid fiber formation chaperone CsgH [Rhizobium sp. CB3090]